MTLKTKKKRKADFNKKGFIGVPPIRDEKIERQVYIEKSGRKYLIVCSDSTTYTKDTYKTRVT